MIIAFTGHRDKQTTEEFLDMLPKDALWVHGGAKGFDSQVENYAQRHNIKTKVIRPDYNKYTPKAAPLIRNKEIIRGADLLVACYDGRLYGGTFYTINLARQQNIPIKYAGISD